MRESSNSNSGSASNPLDADARSVDALAAQHQAELAEQAERDALLLQRLRRAKSRPGGLGDDDAKAALSSLVTRYQDRLFGLCLRMVHGDREAAADLTQDSFLKVLQGLDSYDGRSRLSTWIIRVTMNTCLSYLRSAKVRRTASLDAIRASAGDLTGASVRTSDGRSSGRAGELSPLENVQHTDERRRVAAALASLDPEQRAVLILRDVQGLEYESIGDVLEVPVGTVKSRLFRARLALRDALDPPPPQTSSAFKPSVVPSSPAVS